MATIANSGPEVLDRYGSDPSRLSGDMVALFARHLLSDAEIAAAAGPRERFEAAARSIRDVLAQRCVQTQDAYDQAIRNGSITCQWSS